MKQHAFRLLSTFFAVSLLLLPTSTFAQSGYIPPTEPITSENAAQVRQLAMLGRGTIIDLAWSPDGETIAAAGGAGIWLYDPENLQAEQRWLNTHTAAVSSIIYSADGSLLVSGSADGTVRLWDTATYSEQRMLTGFGDPVLDVAVSSDGRMVAAGFGGERDMVRVWDAGTGDLLLHVDDLEGWNTYVSAVAFTPDSGMLVFSTFEGSLHGFELNSQQRLWSLDNNDPNHRYFSVIGFSADGNQIALSVGSSILIYPFSLENGISSLEQPKNAFYSPISIALTQDWTTIAIFANDSQFDVVDFKTQQPIIRLTNEFSYGRVTQSAFSPNGQYLVVNYHTGGLLFWNLNTTQVEGQLDAHQSSITDIELSSTSSILMAKSEWDRIHIWNLINLELQTQTPPLPTDIFDVSLSPDGALLAISDGSVRLLETQQGDEVAQFPTGNATHAVFSPDGTMLISYNFFSGYSHVSEIPSGEVIVELPGGRLMLFSPDGQIVALDNHLYTLPLSTASQHTEVSVNGDIHQITFSPDSSLFLVSTEEGFIYIWGSTSGDQVFRTQSSTPLGKSIISPDNMLLGFDYCVEGNILYGSSCTRSVVRIIDISTGEEVITLTDYDTRITALAFTPDGSLLITADDGGGVRGGTIRLWSTETWEEVATLTDHRAGINSMIISHDGTLIATASNDGTVRLWGIPVQ